MNLARDGAKDESCHGSPRRLRKGTVIFHNPIYLAHLDHNPREDVGGAKVAVVSAVVTTRLRQGDNWSQRRLRQRWLLARLNFAGKSLCPFFTAVYFAAGDTKLWL
jgi:hypothetical protein